MTDQTDMITLDNTLPATKTKGAKLIAENIARIVQRITSDDERRQMSHALIVAANESSLADCDPYSIMLAAFNAVELGLRPGKTLGLAYFVPKSKKCQLWIGFRGLTTLAKQNGSLLGLHTNVVLEGEEFRQWTDENGPHFHHVVPTNRPVIKHVMIVGAYCVSQAAGGVGEYEWMSRDEIDACRPSHKTPIWDDHPGPMARKTVLKRASKNWVLDNKTARAVELDNQFDRGEPQTADTGEVTEVVAPVSLGDYGKNDGESVGSVTEDDRANWGDEPQREPLLGGG